KQTLGQNILSDYRADKVLDTLDLTQVLVLVMTSLKTEKYRHSKSMYLCEYSIIYHSLNWQLRFSH
ncbi:hypothetical protein AB4344_19095, partial [Vibrio breoganii]